MSPAVASLVAGNLIRDARDEHWSFDERRHPGPVLLRALSRYQRRLVSGILRANRRVLVSEQETALPLANFDTGITVPDYKHPIQVEVDYPQDVNQEQRRNIVNLVPWERRLDYHRAAYLRNNTLYLTGVAADWTSFEKVRIYYIPEVNDLTTYTGAGGTLVVPNAASPCLVAYLAQFMARRAASSETIAAAERREFRADFAEAEEAFLDELAGQRQAELSVVKEVF